jgi:hypothetical protein
MLLLDDPKSSIVSRGLGYFLDYLLSLLCISVHVYFPCTYVIAFEKKYVQLLAGTTYKVQIIPSC